MQEAELYSLIHQKLWTKFLTSLEPGSHLFNFPSPSEVRACTSVAYRLNKDVPKRKYGFVIGNDNYVTIEVKSS